MAEEAKTPYEPVVPDVLEDINFLDGALQNCPYHAYREQVLLIYVDD